MDIVLCVGACMVVLSVLRDALVANAECTYTSK